MGHWVSLKKALMLQDMYGDISKREITYEADWGNVLLTRQKTGSYAIQRFTTDKELTWSPFVYKEEPHLIANGVTNKAIFLVGKRGWVNGREAIKQVASLYGNRSIDAEGVGLTEEMFEVLPKYLRQLDECY